MDEKWWETVKMEALVMKIRGKGGGGVFYFDSGGTFHGFHVLDENHNAIPVKPSRFNEWLITMGHDAKRVRLDIVGDMKISTVFLGLNHASYFGNGPPLLFETMVFSRTEDGETDFSHCEFYKRYSTWDEAVKGHERIVKKLKHEERRSTTED